MEILQKTPQVTSSINYQYFWDYKSGRVVFPVLVSICSVTRVFCSHAAEARATGVPPAPLRKTVKMPDGPDDDALAHDLIEVHGLEAAGVARANARAAALGGGILLAKRWIKVLAAVQRRQSGRAAATEQRQPRRS